MKVVYFSKSFFADCDFPLVKELQRQGVDVRYYIPISYGFKNSSILEFKKPWTKWGIYKASRMEDMRIYRDCIDLNRLYFISGYKENKYNPLSWLLWLVAIIHIWIQRADVMHITWHLCSFERLFLCIPFRGRKVMTIHDPIQHSNTKNYAMHERARIRCFQWSNSFILLNSIQADEFCTRYNINRERISISRLGAYNSISDFAVPNDKINKPYIIYFGLISPYKGLEYLLEAMLEVHKSHPETCLLIAGKGELYFDVSSYKELDYIIWENRYIGVSELVGYVRHSLFAVCPYKDATQSGVVQTAFALNTPVLATNVGNLPRAVDDEKFGKIVPPCDSEALGRAINYLLDNPIEIEEKRKNIMNIWMPSMSWTSIALDYIKVYSKG